MSTPTETQYQIAGVLWQEVCKGTATPKQHQELIAFLTKAKAAKQAPKPYEYTREQLVSLCERGIVPQEQWANRDSHMSQSQIGEAWALLKAGCEFTVILHGSLKSDAKTVWITVKSHGFSYFENGEGCETTENFYIPTEQTLLDRQGEDWY